MLCLQSGDTSLHLAAANGHLETCQLLVQHGASFNRPGHNGQTPLAQACYTRQYETCKVLLTMGASTTECDFEKNTPLHITCYSEGVVLTALQIDQSIDMIKTLLGATNPSAGSHRSYIHAYNGKKETALHIAAKSQCLKVCQFLVEELGANISLVDRHGNSPLHVCGKDPVICAYLIERGADADLKNKDQCTYKEMEEKEKPPPFISMSSTKQLLGSTK